MRTGLHLASVLERSWVRTPSPFQGSALEISTTKPLLLGTGGAALASRRLRMSTLAETPDAVELGNAARLHILQAAMQEGAVARVARAFAEAGISSVLAKGWAIARDYPAIGLRPYGDIDLCVREADAASARKLLCNSALADSNVDLHGGFESLLDRSFDDVVAHARSVDVGGTLVTIPCPEDHLRILCTHVLYHGGWRPLWLCDLGVALDAAGKDFDWERFLGANPVRRNWMACALRLAEQLVGADLSSAPSEVRDFHLPQWVVLAVLDQWESTDRWPQNQAVRRADWLRPRQFAAMLRSRWPDPIRATVGTSSRFDKRTPRLRQLRYSIKRMPALTSALLRSVRAGSATVDRSRQDFRQ